MKKIFLAAQLILFAVFLVLISGSGTSQAAFVRLQLIDGDDPDLMVTFDVVQVGTGSFLWYESESS